MTPPETFAIRPPDAPPDTPGWTVRVVPNKFPALERVDNPVETDFPLMQHPGVGHHEVIIESPRHNISMGHHDPDQAVLICRILRDRYRYHADNFVQRCHSEPFASLKGKLREESHAPIEGLVTIFYNHGPASGASLSHPHFQLLAQSVIPSRMIYLLQHYRQYFQQQGRSVFDDVIEAERDAAERILTCTDDFIAFCPFASRSPFEIYLLPRLEQPHFGQLEDDKLYAFSEILQKTLHAMDKHLNFPDYNIAFHTAPLPCHSERSEESQPVAQPPSAVSCHSERSEESMANQSYHSENLKQPVFEQSVGLEDILSEESRPVAQPPSAVPCHSEPFASLKDKLREESMANQSCHSERSEESLTYGLNYPGFRWYLQIAPRIGIAGGFELATDVFINTIPPEIAAQFLRR